MFSNNIKKLLKLNGYTQSQLANAVGVKPNTVSDWINKGNSPKIEYIYLIADFFNVDINYLFYGSYNNLDNKVSSSNIKLDKMDLMVIQTFNELNINNQREMLNILNKKLEEQKNQVLDKNKEHFISSNDELSATDDTKYA